MKCFEIEKKIAENEKKIQEVLNVQTFVLNKEVQKLNEEIVNLLNNFAKNSNHEDDGVGFCKHCGKKII